MGKVGMIRRVEVVERRIGTSLLIVVPGTREVRVLGPTAALVWQGLDTIGDQDGLDDLLGDVYPDVPDGDRGRAVTEILNTLESDGLVSVT